MRPPQSGFVQVGFSHPFRRNDMVLNEALAMLKLASLAGSRYIDGLPAF
jgi:hypothetical protein